ncbi:MAG: hypothetical protein HFJ02_03010 [Bacilli bacterium]|jgi:hypothetical protein|nr:hypothetical protein [Bacilli bacterium]
MSKKKITIMASIVGVALFVAAIAGSSYAFFIANVETKGNTNPTNVTSGDVKAVFSDGEQLNIGTLVPGDTVSKSFSLENTGTATIKYKIVINDVVNTFSRKSDITYVLKENGVTISTGEFPAANGAISDSITISKGVTNSYTLEVAYINSPTENQAEDMGKTISGKIFIEETK